MFIEFEDDKKFPKKNADIADTHEAFKNAGYLLTENDLVIDIDTIPKPVIEKLISMFNIKTQVVWTQRGAHLYFKKPQGFRGSKKVCPLGFEVEYKHLTNTKQVTVKQNGELRVIENYGFREDLPEIFFTHKKLEPLVGLDENDGRNNALFAHRMKIHDLRQWKSVLRFINNNVFATPLPEEEFQTVSRDGVKIEAGKNKEPEVAKVIMNKYKIVRYLGRLYWIENNHFITDEEKLVRIIFAEVGEVKTRYVEEILKQLKFNSPLIDPSKVFDIKLANGILRAGEFIEIDFKDFTPYTIDIPYFEDATPVPIVDEYLDHLTGGDAAYKSRLLEVLAHTLIVDPEFKRQLAKFFIFVGGGGNGKGTLLRIIDTILSPKNCSALSIKQMADERYFVTMQNKLANLGDDIEDEFINKDQMKLLKNISTCDKVTARALYEQSKDVVITCSLIFTSNHILKSKEKGDSYKRRVDWLPMFAKPTQKDPRFVEKLTTQQALQYWIKLIVEAYKRLYKNAAFTDCAAVQNFNEDYHRMNNNILEFLEERTETSWIGKQKRESYREYKQWAEENDEFPLSAEKFHEELCSIYGLALMKLQPYTKDGTRTTKFTYQRKIIE